MGRFTFAARLDRHRAFYMYTALFLDFGKESETLLDSDWPRLMVDGGMELTRSP